LSPAAGVLDEVAGLGELPPEAARRVLGRFLDALEAGEVRAAVPDAGSPTGWRVEPRVKEGVLAAFALAREVDLARRRSASATATPCCQSRTCRRASAWCRAARRSAAVPTSPPGVVVMPPAYVNVGAWVGEGTLVDSHALVGSCAQIGARVHLSAAAQVGGVLEPVGPCR
jgi:2,3,4,5-tetrahydropyridine-2,6-dicarboxylate N-succinyltransferase